MSTVWIVVIVSGVGTLALKAAGPVLFGGKQLPDRTIFADSITHLGQGAFNRPRHAVKELEFHPALVDPELLRIRLRVRNATDVVRTESRSDDRNCRQVRGV